MRRPPATGATSSPVPFVAGTVASVTRFRQISAAPARSPGASTIRVGGWSKPEVIGLAPGMIRTSIGSPSASRSATAG